jgi:hypothetical protein
MPRFPVPAIAAAALLLLPAAAVAQEVAPGLDRYLAPATAEPATPDTDGFLRRWLVLEPIGKPNRTNTVFTGSYVRDALSPASYPGRFDAVPRDGEIARGTDLRWHALDARPFDVKLFALAQALGKPTYGVIFWAVTVVNSPREQQVRMAVGSNAASRWWLNGEEAVDLYNDRRMVQDDVVSDRITLRRGRNVIRGAVINGPGLSDFCVRFLDEAGRPVTDLGIDLK